MLQETLRLSINRPGAVVLGPLGAALGIEGFVEAGPGIASLRLYLVQAGHRLEAEHVLLQDGLLAPPDPSLSAGPPSCLGGGFYVSAMFPFDGRFIGGPATVEAIITWRSAGTVAVQLCEVEIVRTEPIGVAATRDRSDRRVGIAMATYEPDPALFARQIASIRAQSWEDWICVVCDDGSSPECLRRIAETIGGDARFHLLEGVGRLGFYRNFERACATLLPDCAFLAFSDQDDAWMPDRLARQLDLLSGRPQACTYSDMRVVDRDGAVLSETFWVHRRPAYGSLSGLLLGNVVTGMTVLAGRGLVERALPFPATPGLTYHDHWIALVAARTNDLHYLPEPLAHYVQHGANHTGALVPHPRSRAVLMQGLRRIERFVRLGLLAGRPVAALREPFVLDWLDREPARLRILIERLVAGRRQPGDRALLRLGRRFDLLSLATSGAAWGDRYRRAYAIELWLGGFLKRWIARRVRGHRLLPEPRAHSGALEDAPAHG